MAGYVLGTGTGILAAAATYYTLSSSIRQTTDSLQDEVYRSSALLSSSFDPQTPRTPSSYVGPSYPSQSRFSDTLRIRWNHAISRVFGSVQETDWAAMGLVVVDETGKVVKRLSNQLSTQTPGSPGSSSVASGSGFGSGTEAVKNIAHQAAASTSRLVDDTISLGRQEAEDVESGIRSLWPKLKGAVKEMETETAVVSDELRRMVRQGDLKGQRIDASGAGFVGGDIREESFTGGRKEWVKAKREVEKWEEGRLV